MERSIPKPPFSKLCAMPFALQNRVLFEGEKRAKICREEGRNTLGTLSGYSGALGFERSGGTHVDKTLDFLSF